MCDNWSSDLILKSSFFDLGVVRVHTKVQKLRKQYYKLNLSKFLSNPADIYLFKVNIGNSRVFCRICTKFIIKTHATSMSKKLRFHTA